VELHQTHELAAGEGVVAGGTVGFVAGMLLGGPIGGALLGMVGGGAWGARDTGVPDSRLRELGDSLEPGQALLCALVGEDAAGAERNALSAYGDVADAMPVCHPSVAVTVSQIGDAAERERQPERQYSVRERRHDRLVRRRACERQQPSQAGFHEAETARRERDQRQQRGTRVGEKHERRIRAGPDRGEAADEPEIVEGRSADDRSRRSASGRRTLVEAVALAQQPFARPVCLALARQ
jgi:hypothetical protein